MTTYPFRQGIDYGPRKGTLGIAYHMSEGGDGLVAYLSRATGETDAQWRTRIRGVSANACILSDGTVWQMVDWAHASGSMSPADRNPATTGYYNGTVIRAVLGANYVDPNAWSISCEIAGRRADGPTTAQVRAAIAWGKDMASRFPTLRGAYGHADQTDTKGCPGTTPNMRAIFDGLGGHGLWTAPGGEVQTTVTINTYPARGFKSKAGLTKLRRFNATGEATSITAPYAGSVDGDVTITQSDGRIPRGSGFLRLASGGSVGFYIIAAEVDLSPAPVLDCSAAVKTAVDEALNHVVLAADAVDRAITEARIR